MDSNKKEKKFPEGTWLAIGVSIGIIFGVTTDSIALGSGIGAAIGIVFELTYGSLFRE